jgi:alkylated DNA repair dioxygenase AlkB
MSSLNLENAEVTYYKDFVPSELATKIFEDLSAIMIKNTGSFVTYNDKKYKLSRKTLVLINKDLKDYLIPKIWGENVQIIPFTDEALVLKDMLETELSYKFNICLVNYYATGKRNIGWHSDNEEKGDIECIASLSFGAEREFAFRKKGEKKACKTVKLEDKSLIVMDGGCQYNYEHCLEKDKSITYGRLNMTFRHFKWDTYEKV